MKTLRDYINLIETAEQGVAEGLFGIDDKIKGRIQNIVSDLSDIPGMWDHKAQTFTDAGMDKLKTVLKNNPKYIKYALNLDYRDYEAEGVAEEGYGTHPSQRVDPRTGKKYVPPKSPLGKGVAEGSLNEGQYEMMMRNGQVKKFIAKDDADAKRIAAGHGAKSVIKLKGGVPAGKVSEQGVAEKGKSRDGE